MLPGTRKGTNSGRSSEEAGTNLSRSRRGAAAGGTGDEVTLNPHSYVLRESREHAGQPDKRGQFRVLSTMEELKPREICSETYLVAGAFDTKEEADNYMGYLKTKFVRFLIQQIAMTQQLSRTTFGYVPIQNFKEKWSDRRLYLKDGLLNEEIDFIERIINEMA